MSCEIHKNRQWDSQLIFYAYYRKFRENKISPTFEKDHLIHEIREYSLRDFEIVLILEIREIDEFVNFAKMLYIETCSRISTSSLTRLYFKNHALISIFIH